MNSNNASFGKETTSLPFGFRFWCSVSRDPRFLPSYSSADFKHQSLWFSTPSPYQILGQIQTFGPPLQTNSQAVHRLPQGTAWCSLITASQNSSDSPENLSLKGNADVCIRRAPSLLLTRTHGVCPCREPDKGLPAFTSPKAKGTSHCTQLTRIMPGTPHTALSCQESPGWWSVLRDAPLLQRSPSGQLKDLFQIKGCVCGGEGWKGKTDVPLQAARLCQQPAPRASWEVENPRGGQLCNSLPSLAHSNYCHEIWRFITLVGFYPSWCRGGWYFYCSCMENVRVISSKALGLSSIFEQWIPQVAYCVKQCVSLLVFHMQYCKP